MQIITYKNLAEANRVNKHGYLSLLNTMEDAKLEDMQDMENPTFLYNSSTKPTFNYVYIELFNKYYFVTDVQWVSNDVWRIACAVDVLMSFKDYVYSLNAIVSRLEDQGKHSMIIDDRLTAIATQYEDIKMIDMTPITNEFNVQTGDVSRNIVFSCFSGSEDLSNAGNGVYSLSLSTGGSGINYTPSFNANRIEYNATLPSSIQTVSLVITGNGMKMFNINLSHPSDTTQVNIPTQFTTQKLTASIPRVQNGSTLVVSIEVQRGLFTDRYSYEINFTYNE